MTKEWFLDSICDFCRKMCTVHFVLNYFFSRSKPSEVSRVLRGAQGRRALCLSCHFTEFHPLLKTSTLSTKLVTVIPQPYRTGQGWKKRRPCAPCWASAQTESCCFSTWQSPSPWNPNWNGAPEPSPAPPAASLVVNNSITGVITVC